MSFEKPLSPIAWRSSFIPIDYFHKKVRSKIWQSRDMVKSDCTIILRLQDNTAPYAIYFAFWTDKT